MTLPSSSEDRALNIFLSLAQYPILNSQIRYRMRQELFQRGILSAQDFEAEVREKAIRSQVLEGLHDPLTEEPGEIWETRQTRIRDYLTDFHFAYNLPFELFERIVSDVLAERGAYELVSFNPELAPQSMLFEQGRKIESLPAKERARSEARLREIKVVLIRTMISDHLAYVNIAKDWFTISDLEEIKRQKIGKGKIGGKSAGMLLARRILREIENEYINDNISIPTSYYIGADITYDFMTLNDLMKWLDQKYKTGDEIRREFPILRKEFLAGELPADVIENLRQMLAEVGEKPLIVRSSSLLEDSFGTSFAGKYESHFCPNQGTPRENLKALMRAIRSIYASIFNPDALLYRRSKNLVDYDERMAILIQEVQGERFGKYYLPHVSGVGYSQNLYRWSPQIRKDDGFLRLVWGLGTRAVDRTESDYTRLVALSHPTLHPESSPKATRHYSQHYVDLIDLERNAFRTLPTTEVIHRDYPALRYLAQEDQGGYFVSLHALLAETHTDQLVLTFDELLQRTPLAKRMSRILQTLEKNYGAPIDLEFTAHISTSKSPQPDVHICILQCRPQTLMVASKAQIPLNLNEADVVFSTQRMVPKGYAENIRFVVFVAPEAYFALPSTSERAILGRFIGKLNTLLQEENFICIGPGRWGTSNPDLGIPIGYGDIYNTRALVEVTGKGVGGHAPEASYGTHFFQDLVESNIFPLAIYLDDYNTNFNQDFFYGTPNRVANLLPKEKKIPECLRLIEVASYRPGYHLDLVMDDEKGMAVAFLQPD